MSAPATIDPALLSDDGRMMHIMPVPGFTMFYCPTCHRLIAFDHETGGQMQILRSGDLYASHWGATVDGLRFGGIEVQAGDVT